MFPEQFVARHVMEFTKQGDFTFDPFCGRGTTILQSLLMGRNAAGTDVNPVAYCISAAKAKVPSIASVRLKINDLESAFKAESVTRLRGERAALPVFFKYAFHPATLLPLLYLRRVLNWRNDDVDRFIAALVLGALHGEMDKSSSYMSNQMPRTISTKPNYSISYWRRHRLSPPKREVFALLRARSEFRLRSVTPSGQAFVALADARVAGEMFPNLERKIAAVITSPPYLNVTRYEEDQWLRLWFLGHDPKPTYSKVSRDDRHSSEEHYWEFLTEAWEGIRPLMRKGSVLACRLAAKNVPRKNLTENLYDTILMSFPAAHLIGSPTCSKIRRKQTRYFQPKARGCYFEIDYVFRLR